MQEKKNFMRLSFMVITLLVIGAQEWSMDDNEEGRAFTNFLLEMKTYTEAKIVHFVSDDSFGNQMNKFVKMNPCDMWTRMSNSLSTHTTEKEAKISNEPVILVIQSNSDDFKALIVNKVNENRERFGSVSILIKQPKRFKPYKLLNISPAIRLFAFQFVKVRTMLKIHVSFFHTNFKMMRLWSTFFGTWSHKKGLNTSIPLERCCYDVSGYPVKVVHIGDVGKPYTEVKQLPDNSWKITGIIGDIFTIIVKHLGLRIELVYSNSSIYGSVDEHGRATGLFKELVEKRADVAVASLMITPLRSTMSDLTIGILADHVSGMYKEQPPDKSLLYFYYAPFSYHTWILMTTASLTLSLIAMVFMKIRKLPMSTDFMFDVFGAQLSQGIWREKMDIASEIVFMIAAILGLLLPVFYGSKLVAANTCKEFEKRFNNLMDVANNENYHPIVWSDGSVQELLKSSCDMEYETVWRRIKEDEKINTVSDITTLMSQIENQHGVFLESDIFLKYLVESHRKYALIDYKFLPNWNAMALQKNSPLTRIFNRVILDLIQNGVIDRTKRRYEPRTIQKEIQPQEVGFKDFVGLLFIPAIGIGILFILLIIELLMHSSKKPKTLMSK